MKLIILDRDGVINHDSDEFIKSPEEWLPIDGSLKAISRLHRNGYRVVVITNQSGIARGLFDIDKLNRIHQKMMHEVQENGGQIDSVLFCPHGPDDGCNCRKPKTGMYEELAERLQVKLNGVIAVGDSERDLVSARAVGAQPVLVKTGKGMRTLASADPASLEDVPVYDDLEAAVEAILQDELELQ
jgi:D-glycero-D-manno-heptose 1,7-bisphosphate phosphatase